MPVRGSASRVSGLLDVWPVGISHRLECRDGGGVRPGAAGPEEAAPQAGEKAGSAWPRQRGQISAARVLKHV